MAAEGQRHPVAVVLDLVDPFIASGGADVARGSCGAMRSDMSERLPSHARMDMDG